MSRQRSLAEVESDISAAFHGGAPNSKIRELQAEQQDILGNSDLAETLRVEASDMEERGV